MRDVFETVIGWLALMLVLTLALCVIAVTVTGTVYIIQAR